MDKMGPASLTVVIDTVQKHLAGKHNQQTHAGEQGASASGVPGVQVNRFEINSREGYGTGRTAEENAHITRHVKEQMETAKAQALLAPIGAMVHRDSGRSMSQDEYYKSVRQGKIDGRDWLPKREAVATFDRYLNELDKDILYYDEAVAKVGQQKHLPGAHDQKTHGRDKTGAMIEGEKDNPTEVVDEFKKQFPIRKELVLLEKADEATRVAQNIMGDFLPRPAALYRVPVADQSYTQFLVTRDGRMGLLGKREDMRAVIMTLGLKNESDWLKVQRAMADAHLINDGSFTSEQNSRRMEDRQGMKSPIFVEGHRKMVPTKSHSPLVWENMLGTVYARNPSGKVEYFDYNWDAAHRFANVAGASDLRVSRHKTRSGRAYDGEGSPRNRQMVLYGVHGAKKSQTIGDVFKHLAGKHDQMTHAGQRGGNAVVTLTSDEASQPGKASEIVQHLRGNGTVMIKDSVGEGVEISNAGGEVAVAGMAWHTSMDDTMEQGGSLVNEYTILLALKDARDLLDARREAANSIELRPGYRGQDADNEPGVVDWKRLRTRTESYLTTHGVSEGDAFDITDTFLDELDVKPYGETNYNVVGPTFIKDYGLGLARIVRERKR